MVERLLWEQEVVGSNPAAPIGLLVFSGSTYSFVKVSRSLGRFFGAGVVGVDGAILSLCELVMVQTVLDHALGSGSALGLRSPAAPQPMHWRHYLASILVVGGRSGGRRAKRDPRAMADRSGNLDGEVSVRNLVAVRYGSNRLTGLGCGNGAMRRPMVGHLLGRVA